MITAATFCTLFSSESMAFLTLLEPNPTTGSARLVEYISLHEQHNNFYVIYFRVAHLITTWNLSLIYMFYLHLIYIYMITHPHISVVYLSIYIYIYQA
jgi:hypothetical protein